ncbi:MAG: nicotinate phosphoribosyltransferase [Nannocystaceae bacterium]
MLDRLYRLDPERPDLLDAAPRAAEGPAGVGSLALLTDLYQVTMAQGYHAAGIAEHEAVFNLFFRRAPFKGGYAVAAGLELVIDLLERFRFTDDDRAYLGALTGNDGRPLFSSEFLGALGELRFTCDVDAIPEGRVAFAHEPLVRLRGPLWQCQLLETPLLNLVNFSTLIATKSARICAAAEGDPVLEFGLRRSQGIDGALTAARAAVIGGCAATSNVLAGKLHGIPVRGTHAHAWVMAFPSELEAFEAYARVMPNNCVFLVDTYDTIEGVHHAVAVGRRLRERGHALAGIRLDSGDLRALSVAARSILDEAGFEDASIVASNDLDEHEIAALKAAGAKIGVWGVGTRLATAYDQPALGGVYKLAAIRGPGEPWRYTIKLSEEPIKVSNPGLQQVRRERGGDGRFVGDRIYEVELGLGDHAVALEGGARVEHGARGDDLLVPIFRGGRRVYDSPTTTVMRSRCAEELAALPDDVRRLSGPAVYPVALDARLAALKGSLLQAAREQVEASEREHAAD